MPRHHMIDGVQVTFTPGEETARDAEEAAEAGEPDDAEPGGEAESESVEDDTEAENEEA